MTLDEVVQIVQRRLGSPFVDLEIQNAGLPDESGQTVDMIPLLVNDAFLELSAYIDTIYYTTVSCNSAAIDLSSFNVRTVSAVMRGALNSITNPQNIDGLLFSPIAVMSAQSQAMGFNPYNMSGFVMDYAASLQYRQLRNQIAQDLDFTFDFTTQTLYLYQQIPTSALITVAYTKVYTDITQIEDPFWVNLLIRLSIAYVKEALGRARGKYTMTNAPYELDASSLLSEASSELSEIREFLTSNNEMFLPID